MPDPSEPHEPSERRPAGRPGGRRRSNGLSAPAYAPLLDVDPHAAPEVLAALERVGIAAYIEPAPGPTDPQPDVEAPQRPAERLWVDRALTGAAREVVERTLRELGAALDGAAGGGRGSEPGSRSTDEETAWHQILAAWEDSDAPDAAPWPASEGLGPRPAPVDPPGPQPGTPKAGPAAGRTDAHPDEVSAEPEHRQLGPGPRDWEPGAEPDEEHYIPSPPPPLPRLTRAAAGACLAIVAGFVLLLFPGLLELGASEAVLTVAVLAIVGGAATLLWRLRERPPGGSGPDDGAVV